MNAGGTDEDLLEVPKPAFDPATAEAIAADCFGTHGTATELGGERDQNFRIDADDEGYVLKISNPAEDEGALDLQTAAMRHVHRTDPDLPVMDLIPTVDNDPWTAVEGDDATHFVRLFTLQPGRMPESSELDHDALFDYGAVVARMGEALRGFFHEEARYDILWDLKHTPGLRDKLDAVEDEENRAVAARVLDRFDERVAPAFEGLRAQIIHNDLTLANVLFDDGDRVSGVVDFGDLTHTALVCDLAISVSRVMHGREDPVAAAQAMVRGYVSVTPLEDEEARLLVDFVAARLAARGVIAAWRVRDHPENAEYIAGSAHKAWELLHEFDAQGWDAVGRRLRTAALSGNVPYQPMETDDLLSRRRDVLGESPLFYRDPIHFVAGEGVWLFDPDGNRYLDCYNNVQVVGHANPEVAAAVGGQARKLATHTRYLHESAVALGERLTETMPAGLDTVMLVNSGSEANDVAMRLAEAATGNRGAVVTDHAYHGITEVATALSPEVWPEGYGRDRIETVPPPAGDRAEREPATAVADAAAALDARGHGAGAFVFDSLFTSDGIHPPDGAQLRAMADAVREAGGLVVADEVQSGYGRSGSMWGFEAADLTPDVVTLGKPMGNGHPVAAVVTRREIASALWDRTGMFSTFAGNPVSAAAALAVLDVIEDRELLAHVADVGGYLRGAVRELAADHELVTDVRGAGLMLGIELRCADGSPATGEATEVLNRLRHRRVLVGSTGAGNVLKIRPPLVFERAHADHLLGELDGALSAVSD